MSKSDTDYVCLVACQKINLKQILIFDINQDHNQSKTKILNYQHEANELTKVDISVDFKQIVFVNKTENFEIVDMGTYYVQRNMNQLKDKIVRYIAHSPEHDGFYFVAHMEYDSFLDVDHSKRNDYQVDF